MMRAWRVACLGALALAACGTSSSEPPDAAVDAGTDAFADADAAPLCPDDLPDSCPSPIPSYKKDVAAIFTAHCTVCHSPMGVVPNAPLTTYADVQAQASATLTQVYQCEMPPKGYPFLSTTERLTLLGWLVCHAPNN